MAKLPNASKVKVKAKGAVGQISDPEAKLLKASLGQLSDREAKKVKGALGQISDREAKFLRKTVKPKKSKVTNVRVTRPIKTRADMIKGLPPRAKLKVKRKR